MIDRNRELHEVALLERAVGVHMEGPWTSALIANMLIRSPLGNMGH